MNCDTRKEYSDKPSKGMVIIGLIFLGLAFMLPGQVFAQCNGSTSVDFAGSTGPFEIGEEIPIKVTIAMGEANPATVLNVSHFQYWLDCAAGDISNPGCTSQGNGVAFIGPVTTNCPLEVSLSPPTAILYYERGDTAPNLDIVDFWVRDDNAQTPSSNAQIRLASTAEDSGLENTCDVEFKVSIDSLSVPNSTDPIIEFSVFSNLDAQCDNEDSITEKDELTIPIVNPNVVIWVTKDFTDDNENPVDIHLYCDTGIYTNPDFQIVDPAAGVGFPTKGYVVYGIPSLGANCRVWETPVSGYAGSYVAGAKDGALYDSFNVVNDLDDTDEFPGCYFKAVLGGEFTCDITNTPGPVEVEVTKVWEVTGTGGDYFSRDAKITIGCDAEITGYTSQKDDHWYYKKDLDDGDYVDGQYTVTVEVIPDYPSSFCFAAEHNEYSAVQVTSDCGDQEDPAMEVSVGQGASCTITNTLFFEGIPTLNQYGMALMALLMLGLGVLGSRRFA